MERPTNYWMNPRRGISRRRALKGFAAGAAGVAAVNLVGCGDDDDASQVPAGSATASPASQIASPSAAPTESPVPGGRVAIALSNDPPSLDVFRSVSFASTTPISFSMSRLLRFKPQTDPKKFTAYEPEGELAESWEHSPDLMTWTFKLRPNVRFHNGNAFTSEDVAASFERFNTLPAANKPGLGMIEKLETPDPLQVVFKLNQPYSPLPIMLASPSYLWIYPKEVKAGAYDPTKTVIGTGPFLWDGYDVGVAIRFKKNPDYFRPGLPYLDEVTMNIVKDTQARLGQLRSGALHLSTEDSRNFESIKSVRSQVRGIEYAPLGFWHIYFQSLDPNSPTHDAKSPFNDVRVRRAVSMALDRDAILNIVYQGHGVWNNLPPVGMLGSIDPRSSEIGEAGKYFKKDVGQAKQLLAEAGYPNGFETKLNYVLTVFGDVYQQQVELAANMLKGVGINATLTGIDYASNYLAKSILGDSEGMTIAPETLFFDPDEWLFSLLHSSSRRNRVQIKDSEIDRLIAAERKETDQAVRASIVNDITRRNADQMYYVPTVLASAFAVSQPEVQGFALGSPTGQGSETFERLWIKKA